MDAPPARRRLAVTLELHYVLGNLKSTAPAPFFTGFETPLRKDTRRPKQSLLEATGPSGQALSGAGVNAIFEPPVRASGRRMLSPLGILGTQLASELRR